MRVAHLVLPKATAMELVDQMAPRQTVVDLTTLTTTTQCAHAERHAVEASERRVDRIPVSTGTIEETATLAA
jgi:proline racemase